MPKDNDTSDASSLYLHEFSGIVMKMHSPNQAWVSDVEKQQNTKKISTEQRDFNPFESADEEDASPLANDQRNSPDFDDELIFNLEMPQMFEILCNECWDLLNNIHVDIEDHLLKKYHSDISRRIQTHHKNDVLLIKIKEDLLKVHDAINSEDVKKVKEIIMKLSFNRAADADILEQALYAIPPIERGTILSTKNPVQKMIASSLSTLAIPLSPNTFSGAGNYPFFKWETNSNEKESKENGPPSTI